MANSIEEYAEIKPLAPKSDFFGLENCVYLYNGAEGPFLKSGIARLERYAGEKSKGAAGIADREFVQESCRQKVAELLQANPQDIGFLCNSSEGINVVANSIGWNEGDNVVINNMEWPSNVYAWLRHRDKGVEVRVVEHVDWDIPIEKVDKAVDKRTRVVAVSHVSFSTGFRHDLLALSDIAHSVGALLCVDATQSVGVLQVDAKLCDFLCTACYKWLLGPHGVAIFYWNRNTVKEFLPSSVGWRSVVDISEAHRYYGYELKMDARRVELGMPSYPGLYLLDNSLAYLARFPKESIERHALALGQKIIEGVESLGLKVITPKDPMKRGGNICFLSTRYDEIGKLLQERGIFVAGFEGRVRVSTHLYNSSEDVDHLLRALREIRELLGGLE